MRDYNGFEIIDEADDHDSDDVNNALLEEIKALRREVQKSGKSGGGESALNIFGAVIFFIFIAFIYWISTR